MIPIMAMVVEGTDSSALFYYTPSQKDVVFPTYPARNSLNYHFLRSIVGEVEILLIAGRVNTDKDGWNNRQTGGSDKNRHFMFKSPS
jgi:hypothetical protein